MTQEPALSPRDEMVVREFLRCRLIADAAKACGFSVRTLQRRLKKPVVQDAISAETRRLLREATAELGRGAGDAARALVDMAKGEAVPNPARVAACRAVIEGASRLVDLEELEERLAEFEAAKRGDLQ